MSVVFTMTSVDRPATQSNFEQRVYSVGSAISLPAFHITIGIVFGVAIICAIARFIMRYLTKRPIYWDDFFLGLGVVCFIADTGILYGNTYYYYLTSALQLYPSLAFLTSLGELDHLLNVALPALNASAGCAWTTIFCVKASFLIVSKQLISRLPWLNGLYFWSVVALTICSWVVLVAAPWIECPYTGWDSGTYKTNIMIRLQTSCCSGWANRSNSGQVSRRYKKRYICSCERCHCCIGYIY